MSLLLAGLLALSGAAADGKGKHKKKHKAKPPAATIAGPQQHQILESGQITVTVAATRRRSLEVHALAGGTDLGPVTGASAAPASGSLSLPLTDAGRSVLSDCNADALAASVSAKKKKKKKKKHKKKKRKAAASILAASTALDRDLAICSVGSENPTARPYYGPPIPTANADRCDFLDPTVCMQPFPNDYFTKSDPSTATDRRLNFQAASMPHNKFGTAIDPTDFNHADGFSPGNAIIIKIPQVETQAAFNNSGLVRQSDPHRYLDPGQPAVVINTDTGQRQPIFAELDAQPNHYTPGNTHDVNLIIRPLKNLDEGGHFVVGLRSLKDASGQSVPPPMPFRVYRDRLITGQSEVETRRPHIETTISQLQGAGIPRANLYMAWDFTVASETSLAGRALALRDNALSRTGDTAPGDPITGTGDTTPGDGVVDGDSPSFNISSVLDAGDPGLDSRLQRQIDGELTNVPCYLNNANCHPGGRLTFPPGSDTPSTNPTGFADDTDAGTTGVKFRCIIPKSVITGGMTLDPAKPGVFGHGLLGNRNQVSDMIRPANLGNSVWCATNWAGFSEDDLGSVGQSLPNLSNFPKLTDRMVQGFVNFTYLGRAMDNPNGFKTDMAFKVDPDGMGGLPAESAIDTSNDDLYYEGISQGAIMGGAFTALSTDATQSVLNVPGMNYSTLLSRSSDSGEYLEIPTVGLYANYPDQLQRQLIFGLMQLIWDRGEANGYAQHMTTDPLPGTPQHHVLLQPAVGDFQVSNLTAEVEARTIGASVYQPALDPGRHWDVNPFVGIPSIGSFPFSGSALVYYDGGPVSWFNNAAANTPAGMECKNADPTTNPCQGSAVEPTVNLPPTPGAFGVDPHGYPRRSVDALQHVTDWLQPSGFINPCTDPGPVNRPCYANGWTGP